MCNLFVYNQTNLGKSPLVIMMHFEFIQGPKRGKEIWSRFESKRSLLSGRIKRIVKFCFEISENFCTRGQKKLDRLVFPDGLILPGQKMTVYFQLFIRLVPHKAQLLVFKDRVLSNPFIYRLTSLLTSDWFRGQSIHVWKTANFLSWPLFCITPWEIERSESRQSENAELSAGFDQIEKPCDGPL